MPRRARVVIPGLAHHVVQRGNYQQNVFEKDQDFRSYLYLIKENSEKYQLNIHAYCLMSNHVHFVITPGNLNGLADMFRDVHARYSQYKNLQKNTIGHLWQARFYSCVLSESHLLRAVRYVEMNPVRALMVHKPWDYPWSSARWHVSLEQAPIVRTVRPECFQNDTGGSKPWKTYLLEEDLGMMADIRKKTQKGLAIGSINCIMDLEKKWGINLREVKRGRPKKG